MAHQNGQIEQENIRCAKKHMVIVQAVMGATFSHAEILIQDYDIKKFDNGQVDQVGPLEPG